MRAPCKHCGASRGWLQPKNGQDCVYCGKCGKWSYNASKGEVTRAAREMQQRSPGRPPMADGKARSYCMRIMMRPDEHSAILEMAAAAEMHVSEWARRCLLKGRT
jgi:hypothetical protein